MWAEYGEYQLCVTDVTADGWLYDSSANIETCGVLEVQWPFNPPGWADGARLALLSVRQERNRETDADRAGLLDLLRRGLRRDVDAEIANPESWALAASSLLVFGQ